MKKLLAMLLAMLMLLGMAALAEPEAGIVNATNLRVETDGQRVEVEDFQVSLVLQNINDIPSLALLMDGGGKSLFTAVTQLVIPRYTIAIDGMDHGYAVELPAQQLGKLAGLSDADLVPAVLLMLDNAVLPALSGVNIPKMDLSGLLALFTTGQGTFEIPYEQVNQLLDMVLQLAKLQGQGSQIDEFAKLLEDLKRQGAGIAIKGTLEDGASQTVVANIHIVQNGTTGDEPLLRLTLESSENNVSLAVGLVQDSGTLDVVSAALTSDPSAPRLDFDINAIEGSGVSFDAFNEDGLSRYVLGFNMGGQGGSFEFAYGQQGGNDIVSLAIKADGADLSLVINTVMGADGARTGNAEFSTIIGDQYFNGACDLTLYKGDAVDLNGFTMPTDLRPVDQMTTDDIAPAFEPVIDYIDAHGTPTSIN